ncbi:MAG: HAMP domain-containing protein, partial [Novibacillus thermophilus]
MIWRSVVGKLWLTIIGLVSVVLIVLVLLLIQFLDQFFENENERSLTTLSQELAQMIEDSGSGQSLQTRRHVIEMAEELLPAYNTQMVVLTAEGNGASYDYFTTAQEESLGPIEQLLKRSDLKEVFEGKEKKVRGTLDVEVEGGGETEETPPFEGDVLAVAEPIRSEGDVIGAIVLYQSLSQLEHTTNRTKEIVFYAALIGIFLTTFFAFFLSSRVTQPLLKMKQAANEMAEGNFDIRVPARTHDEIGELAGTFNRMGAQLEESIHALSQEKEQLSSVLKSMTDAVITVNADGHVIITNPPADHLLEMWSEPGEDQRQ